MRNKSRIVDGLIHLLRIFLFCSSVFTLSHGMQLKVLLVEKIGEQRCFEGSGLEASLFIVSSREEGVWGGEKSFQKPRRNLFIIAFHI